LAHGPHLGLKVAEGVRPRALLASLGLRQLGEPRSNIRHGAGRSRIARCSGVSGCPGVASRSGGAGDAWRTPGSVATVRAHRCGVDPRRFFWTNCTALS